MAACAQVASAAPARARVVPATFQNIVKSYPPPLGYFERSVMRRAAGWIAFGETVHEAQASKPYYAARPSRVIPPGVDVPRFRPDGAARAAVRTRLGWNDDTPVVGFLGRFIPAKGLDVLMQALDGAASAVARALRGRRSDGCRSVGVRRRASRACARAHRCRP